MFILFVRIVSLFCLYIVILDRVGFFGFRSFEIDGGGRELVWFG